MSVDEIVEAMLANETEDGTWVDTAMAWQIIAALRRLEKLEALVEAAEKVKTFSGYLKEDGTYWIVEDLVDALAALEGDV